MQLIHVATRETTMKMKSLSLMGDVAALSRVELASNHSRY
jgi:hypothetical protein